MYFDRIFCSQLRPTLAALSAIAALAFPAHAADAKVNESLLQKNFPFQGACISATFPAKNTAMKGLAIRLPDDAGANVLFDTDLCRMAAGWTGGYISTRGVTYDGSHGGHPAIVGTQKFGTAVVGCLGDLNFQGFEVGTVWSDGFNGGPMGRTPPFR